MAIHLLCAPTGLLGRNYLRQPLGLLFLYRYELQNIISGGLALPLAYPGH